MRNELRNDKRYVKKSIFAGIITALVSWPLLILSFIELNKIDPIGKIFGWSWAAIILGLGLLAFGPWIIYWFMDDE